MTTEEHREELLAQIRKLLGMLKKRRPKAERELLIEHLLEAQDRLMAWYACCEPIKTGPTLPR
jgi:hypothetical protein